MRPQSIIAFERLFLSSLGLGVLNFALSYQDATTLLAQDPGARQFGLGSGFLVGVTIASYAFYLLLWFLVARKASNVAKWILVVLTAVGVLFALPGLAGPWTTTTVLGVATYALGIAAVVCLFRSDALAWFGGAERTDSAASD